MPVFEYVCEICGQRFEHQASAPLRPEQMVCPNGHQRVRRVYSAPSVIYRGGGWYSKDNSAHKK